MIPPKAGNKARSSLLLQRLILLVALAGYTVTSAADAPGWPPAGVSFYGDTLTPDVSGLWLGTVTGEPGVPFAPNRGSADGRPATFWSPWPLPYTPMYQKIYDDRVLAAKNGRALGDVGAQCLPVAMPKALVSKTYPDEIVQTPGQVTIFVYNHFPEIVWTDGRGHPKNLAASYNGHSIGYWLGDMLFVDTVGILGSTPLDAARNPHSATLRMTWTLQRVADETLHIHATLYDEDAFTTPVTTTNIWHRLHDVRWQILDDASCFESNHNAVDETGAVGFKKF